MITKIVIGGVGVVVSLFILSSSGANGIIGVLIVMAIALIWAANHKSEEKTLLFESASHYLTETEELEAELKSLNERTNELDGMKT